MAQRLCNAVDRAFGLGCSFEKPKPSICVYNLDHAHLLNKSPRVEIPKKHVIPDTVRADGTRARFESGVEKALVNSRRVDALAILSYEPNVGPSRPHARPAVMPGISRHPCA
jgi:hypothetical protein